MAEKSEQKYTQEALLRSKEFAHVQRDFLSVLLAKPEYTISEAKKVVEDFFGKKDGE